MPLAALAVLLLAFSDSASWQSWRHGSRPASSRMAKRSAPSGMSGKDPIADEVQGFDSSFIDTFLSKYWQKKPLLIRRALHEVGSNAAIDQQDLLELSVEEDVQSRIVTKSAKNDPDRSTLSWSNEEGPFEPSVLDEIPAKDWTILVQEVDRHVPAVADLWDRYFSFAPLWRRDDVMASYSRKGGGIGGHVDNYDVFLIQGGGTRRWSIENAFLSFDEELKRDSGEDIRLLSGFSRDQSWELQPGDMLYLPARIPHEGVALDDECLTLSMGFRAPSMQSLVTAYAAHVAEGMFDHDLLSDASLDAHKAAAAPGRVQIEAAALVQSELDAHLQTHTGATSDHSGAHGINFDKWLGKYLTTPLRARMLEPMPFFLEDWLSEAGSSFVNNLTDTVGEPEELDYARDDELDSGDQELYLELPLSICHERFSVASTRTFANAEAVVSEVLEGHCALRLLEGVRAAYTQHHVCFDGKCHQLPAPQEMYEFVGPLLCDSRVITPEQLHAALDGPQGNAKLKSMLFTQLLTSLVHSGYYYPVDL